MAFNTNTPNFIQLGMTSIPLRVILSYLPLMDKIDLASTSTIVRGYCVQESQILQRIENSNELDISNLCCLIHRYNIKAIVRTFPNLNSFIAHLGNIEDHLLDELRKLEHLRELKLFIGEGHRNYNRHGINVLRLTIMAEYYQSRNDNTYDILWQVRGFRHLTIFYGQISNRTILLMSTRNLISLKLHNCVIHPTSSLSDYILENPYLKSLQLTTSNHLLSPYPCLVMNTILSLLPAYHKHFILENLTFTLDQDRRINYSNLNYLTKLRQLTIYFTVQNTSINLEKMISFCKSFTQANITFIEYIEEHRILDLESLNNMERRSYFYSNIIEGLRNHMSIQSINYDTYKNNNPFNFIN